jgi:hypothetical protein
VQWLKGVAKALVVPSRRTDVGVTRTAKVLAIVVPIGRRCVKMPVAKALVVASHRLDAGVTMSVLPAAIVVSIRSKFVLLKCRQMSLILSIV